MKELIVELKERSYSIVIAEDFKNLGNYIGKKRSQCVIIADDNVAKYYLDSLMSVLSEHFVNVYSYIVASGEESKSLEEAIRVYAFLIKHNINRDDVIFTLGGGVIGDLGGFVAATFLRGITYVQVPTSLLAQIDSSIGGKTAVDMNNLKNIIGAFYQPSLVYINPILLKTLPIEEVRNGLVEILVHGIILNESLFEYVDENLEKIYALEQAVIEKLIYWNCMIKKEVVQKDEKDQQERAILNFGHTFGHAIEGAYDYQYRHGECVAIGIIGACYIAERLNLIEKQVTYRIKSLLIRMQVLRQIADCDKEKVLNFLIHDKKNVDNHIYFILPVKVGMVKKYKIEDFEIVRQVLTQLTEEKWMNESINVPVKLLK